MNKKYKQTVIDRWRGLSDEEFWKRLDNIYSYQFQKGQGNILDRLNAVIDRQPIDSMIGAFLDEALYNIRKDIGLE